MPLMRPPFVVPPFVGTERNLGPPKFDANLLFLAVVFVPSIHSPGEAGWVKKSERRLS